MLFTLIRENDGCDQEITMNAQTQTQTEVYPEIFHGWHCPFSKNPLQLWSTINGEVVTITDITVNSTEPPYKKGVVKYRGPLMCRVR